MLASKTRVSIARMVEEGLAGQIKKNPERHRHNQTA